jgi:GNAT superfamily N-acetyltransferase
MSEQQLSPISVADAGRVSTLLTAAFADNPFSRWLFPSDDDYTQHFPEFVSVVVDGVYEAETAWQLDDFAAVALVRGPNVEPDTELIGSTLRTIVAEHKRAELFDTLEQLEAAHPQRLHWFIPLIAVDPAQRGKGLGSRLLNECLEQVDATGLPAFLQSYSVRTVPFFERHGFAVTGRVEVGTVPVLTMMLRDGSTE